MKQILKIITLFLMIGTVQAREVCRCDGLKGLGKVHCLLGMERPGIKNSVRSDELENHLTSLDKLNHKNVSSAKEHHLLGAAPGSRCLADRKAALEELDKLKKNGNGHVHYLLATLNMHDRELFYKHVGKAAQKGHPLAMKLYGDMLVKKGKKGEAEKWHRNFNQATEGKP